MPFVGQGMLMVLSINQPTRLVGNVRNVLLPLPSFTATVEMVTIGTLRIEFAPFVNVN